MKYLKIFESLDSDNKKDAILFNLAELVILQEKYNALEGDLTHQTVTLAFEEFNAKSILILLFGDVDNLTMAINAVFDEFLRGNPTARIDFDLNIILDENPNQVSLSWRMAAEFLKYCDYDNDIKNQLTNWEDVLSRGKNWN